MANVQASVQIGEVNSVDWPAKTVKVLHLDANGSVSTDLPIMRPKPKPEIGDPVLCVYLSNGSAFGICLGEFYEEDNKPSEDGIIEIAVLPDGGFINYNTNTQTLILSAPHVVTVQTGG